VVSTRRTQAERSAATTAKILDASTECLIDLGWTATTTTEVCRRAGVSRGALLHHFPTRSDLVAATVRHIMGLRVQEFRATMMSLGDEVDTVHRLETAIDVLASIFMSPTIEAWIELVVAGRTDSSLQPLVAEMQADTYRAIQSTWDELFPPDPAMPPGFYDVAPRYLVTLLEGLAINRLTGDPEAAERAEVVLLTTKVIVRTMSSTDIDIITDHLIKVLEPGEIA
jgi:AcrR family transcriptional regulator